MFTSKSMIKLGWLMLVTDILLAVYCHFNDPTLTRLFLIGGIIWGIGIFVWSKNLEQEEKDGNQ
jgi:hypothetical protein